MALVLLYTFEVTFEPNPISYRFGRNFRISSCRQKFIQIVMIIIKNKISMGSFNRLALKIKKLYSSVHSSPYSPLWLFSVNNVKDLLMFKTINVVLLAALFYCFFFCWNKVIGNRIKVMMTTGILSYTYNHIVIYPLPLLSASYFPV